MAGFQVSQKKPARSWELRVFLRSWPAYPIRAL